nr:MBL fold metallo-hydrolase [Paenibacillus roseus]
MNVALPQDIAYKRTLIVNVVLIGVQGSNDWVLVDTGMSGFADSIAEWAEERFPSGRARAIILTHGHFDHTGSVGELMNRWGVPVYAHKEEMPYLTGQADYPEADPEVGGGLMATVSPLYPHKGIDLGRRIRPLPDNGEIRELPGWEWIHTPGHTKGHTSLFRKLDRTLVAGDAFITVKQESLFAVITQDKEIHGPPAYFTPDWDSARESVKRLCALNPRIAITGHGVPLGNEELSRGLRSLAENFNRIALPKHGKYVHTGQ